MAVAVAEHGLGPLEAFPVGKIRLVEIEGREVGILRTRDRVFAIGNRCPHQGAPLCAGRVTGTMLASDPNEYVYGEDGLVIRCPWHGFEFHVATGESVGGALRGRVPTYQVEVRDGEVFCLPPATTAGGAVRVHVDQPACTAGGLCEEAVPEIFLLDNSGLATVIEAGAPMAEGGTNAGGVEVPRGLEDRVRDAAAACPGACIFCDED